MVNVVDVQALDVEDLELVEDARAGDVDAFTTLYERHHARVLRLCRNQMGNADDAADAAQETFLRAWRSLRSFRNEGALYPWLHTIARNVCTDALRRKGRLRTVADDGWDALPDDGPNPDDCLAARVDHDLLIGAFDRLSTRHREVLQLREYAGWTYERIASEEQLELNAVKSLVWRARQALRRELLELTAEERYGIGSVGLLGRLLAALRRAGRRTLHVVDHVVASGSPVAGSTAASAAITAGGIGVLGTAVVTVAIVLPGGAVPSARPPLPPPDPAVAPATARPVMAGITPPGGRVVVVLRSDRRPTTVRTTSTGTTVP